MTNMRTSTRLILSILVFCLFNMVAVASYLALSGGSLNTKSDTLTYDESSKGNIEIGNLSFEAMGKSDEAAEVERGLPRRPAPKPLAVQKLKKDGRESPLLRSATAHFNRPTVMNLDEITEIVLVVTRTKDEKAFALGTGQRETAEVMVSGEVVAKLSGPPHFNITSRGGEKQLLGAVGFAQWIWDVSPKQAQHATLTLEIFAVVGTQENRILAKRFDIPVEVSWWGRTKIYLSELNPVVQAGAPIVSAIAAVLAWLGLQPKRTTTNPQAPAPPVQEVVRPRATESNRHTPEDPKP